MQAPEILGGRYELRGVLGRGGMAEVRDGWDTRLDRPVAVKLLHPMFTIQSDSRKRFEIEARAAAALNHPHIVAVHDSGEHDGTPYIVMERLSGRTLGDAIAGGPLPQEQVRKITGDVLSALAVAHAAGVLHRDIKPANILLTDTGEVKVADFGIAKSAATPHTMTGQLVGTMGYLSADRLAGKPATVADDLYAVGVVGYEALSGQRPFPQQNLPALARAVAEGQPPPLAMARPDVDPALAAAVERAMALDPRWRFGGAEEMRAAVFGASRPVSPPPPVRPPTRVMTAPVAPPSAVYGGPPAHVSRTHKLLLLAAMVAALVLASVLVLFGSALQPNSPEPSGTNTSVPTPTTMPRSSATTTPTTSPSATSSPVPADQTTERKRPRKPNGNQQGPNNGGGD